MVRTLQAGDAGIRAHIPGVQDRDVVFVGVAYADTEPEARTFAEQVGVTYPLGMDSTDEISAAYEIQALPTTFFIDREGII